MKPPMLTCELFNWTSRGKIMIMEKSQSPYHIVFRTINIFRALQQNPAASFSMLVNRTMLLTMQCKSCQLNAGWAPKKEVHVAQHLDM